MRCVGAFSAGNGLEKLMFGEPLWPPASALRATTEAQYSERERLWHPRRFHLAVGNVRANRLSEKRDRPATTGVTGNREIRACRASRSTWRCRTAGACTDAFP